MNSRTDPSNVAQTPVTLHARTSIEQVEEGHELAPKFDDHGLMVCVTAAADSGEVLMLGHMNREALEKTIQTGEAHYWSRSRKKLWHKGATSGLVQVVEEMRIDDDQDARARCWLRCELPRWLSLVLLSKNSDRVAAPYEYPTGFRRVRKDLRSQAGVRRRT